MPMANFVYHEALLKPSGKLTTESARAIFPKKYPAPLHPEKLVERKNAGVNTKIVMVPTGETSAGAV